MLYIPHGFVCKWNIIIFILTHAGISELFSPLESAVCTCFLPKLVPHAVSDVEHELFSNPVLLGGLGICNPLMNGIGHF